MTGALEAVIRTEIERGGPMTFARFMELALYHPGLGYYMSSTPRPTRAGDFLTAPELHPIFGHAIARQLEEIWERLGRPAPFTLVEYGAGSGALAGGIVAGLERDASGLRDTISYVPIELNPHRRDDLHRRASEAGWSEIVGETGGESVAGCVLANEFLDASPAHLVTWSGGRLHEIYVRVDAAGSFAETIGEPSSDELATTAAERFEAGGHGHLDGHRFEVSLGLDGWVREAAARLESGVVLVIDYGHAATDLYAPSRVRGTIRAYARHDVSDDPYQDVGDRDITAHVDVTALRRAADLAGLAVLGEASHADFLLGCGLEDLFGAARNDPGLTMPDYLELRSAIRRLLDPRGLGAFRVLGFSRGVDSEPPLRGFGQPTVGG